MSAVFLKLLNLSITASWLILAVILARFLLKKAPKWISCVLWVLVAIRLVCPFSLESALSLVPSSETVNTTHFPARPYIQSGVDVIDNAANDYLGSHYFEGVTVAPSDSLTNPINVISIIWIIGMAAMLLYALISYIRLKKSVGASVPVRDNILACDEAKSPFILGIIKPVIYVPSSMTDPTLDYVITHEAAHIKRHDHWWKPFGFLLLAIYWFNPLCWLAYILLCRDIEMACDEKVIRDMDKGNVAEYSQALLDCSFPRRRIAACPLAFGEVGVKERVKSVLNYKKPAFWIIVVAVLACIIVAVCFMTNPKKDIPDSLPLLHSHSYGVVEVTYEASGYDFSMIPQQNTPVYTITEDMQLMSKGEFLSDEWTELGTLTEIDLTKENFDSLFSSGGKWFTKNENAAYFRKNNANAWAVIYQQDTLYYVLQQKNGEVLLAYGYNDYSEKNDPHSDDSNIRWLYRLAYDIHQDIGLIAVSGKNVIPVVVFSVGTPITDIKDSVYWLDIAPGPDDSVPFTVYCDGYEQYGPYGIFDAKTMESLEYFMPSGLSPQTYLFQNAEDGHNYIVTLLVNETDLLCFGARIGNASVISKIVDPTKDPNFSYDTAVEKFYEDNNNEYFFGGIYSKHVIVQYADGSEEDIVTALYSGRASISDLDRFDIRYWTEPKKSSLDDAISKAILEHYASNEPDGLIHVESHVILGKDAVSGTPLLGSDKIEDHITYYLFMHHEKFSTYGGELEAVGGSSGPVAITFRSGSDGENILEEYWEPRDGSYYTKDIRDKFPAEAAELALSQAYSEELKYQNMNKAFYILNNSSSINVKIAELLDTIQASPAYSSNPGDYIREHESEYNELIGFGKYTLQYCFSKFLNGEQTDLRGHIMASVCNDIAEKCGESLIIDGNTPSTGQEWFDEFLSNAEILAKQYSHEDLEKYYPASFLLLQISDANW